MNPEPTLFRPAHPLRFAAFAALSVCFAWLGPAAVAQPAATGRIAGRVFNPATGEFVRNAEIRLTGTDLTAYSEEGGYYQLDHVPAGAATIEVTFTGYTPATATVQVAAGQTVSRDFELVSALAPARGPADETVRLDRYVVSADREGNAKAIMEQRRNTSPRATSANSSSFSRASTSNMSTASAAGRASAGWINNTSA
jgi:hypothetical protein